MRKPRNSEDLKEYRIIENVKKRESVFLKSKLYGSLNIGLIFPGNYNLAVSSLGYNRIYEIMNSVDGVNCERFYMDKGFNKYYSLDSSRPLDEFDVWAFSVSFEMDYFNIIKLFKDKNIPLLSAERDEKCPLVMVGGAVTYFNASPLFPISDIIFHGDAESSLEVLVKIIKDGMESGYSKYMLLDKAKDQSNLSIPLIGKKFEKLEKSMEIVKNPAKSVFVSQSGEFGKKPLVEIGRGCIRSCNFCAAGSSRKPARFVNIESIKYLLDDFNKKGFDDFGFISATATDYPFIEELMEFLELRQYKFSVSSLRLDSLSDGLISGLKRSGQKSMTIAPEGGSQKMRDVFRKEISEKDIEIAFKKMRKHEIDEIKMYFIFGMDEENEEDLNSFSSIAVMAENYGFKKISMSFNPLIPKPSTFFENRIIQDIHVLKEKQKFIRKSLNSNIKTKFESIKESSIQFELANGTVESLLKYL